MGIWLEKLESLGVNKIIINTHHLSEQVNNFISSSHINHKILTVHEDRLLGTAGTLINNLPNINLDEDLIMLHADNYTTDDLSSFVQHYKKRPPGCIMTMLAFRTDFRKIVG